jgi:hypothetical protein
MTLKTRRRPAFAVLALVTALLAGLSVSPASAGTSSAAAAPAATTTCLGWESGAATFSSLGRLAATSAARGRVEPVLRNGPSDSEIPGKSPKTSNSFTAPCTST